jgi:hypothetical protein
MIRGSLFSRYFLDDGIRQTDAYRALDPAAVTAFADRARALWQPLEAMPRPSEAETESEFIFPLLSHLGWHALPQQDTSKSRRDIADAVLFLDEPAKTRAKSLQHAERFKLASVVVESEARDTLLDRAGSGHEAPSSQILRYLSRADSQTNGQLAWGLLTNARFWRLYWAAAPDRASGFVELDLPGLLGHPPPAPAGAPPDHWLRVFLLIFSPSALALTAGRTQTFLEQAIADGRTYQDRITAALSKEVFDKVFPTLIAAIAANDPAANLDDPAWREDARESALRLLYRLLFLLYAEDRDLLPVRHPGYEPYSLHRLREEAARVADSRQTLSSHAVTWWPRLTTLFAAIDQGDAALGLPPYNGRLFHDDPGAMLTRLALPDATLAPLIDALSRSGEGLIRRWINFRDLSVQHLGSIYERLLERDVVRAGAGVALRPNPFARKTTGSYYTPDELVQLIIRRAIGPLLEERRAAFRTAAQSLASDKGRLADRAAKLARTDAAEAFLSLRVCDPAMGSGHFLVSLVDYLTAQTLEEIAEAATIAAWAQYRSPLMSRIETIRAEIKSQAAANAWPVRDEHLDDRHIIRRIILKRCVFGVDLNPMAVELAKLSLWLHSFTVGAPLSFLDHHLRCGDSLFGEFVAPVEADLRNKYRLSLTTAVASAVQAAAGMALVEQQADADIAGVILSASNFAAVEQDTAALRAFLDLFHAARWLPPQSPAGRAGHDQLFGGGYGDPVAIAAGRPPNKPLTDAVAIPIVRRYKNQQPIPATDAFAAAMAFVADARTLATERRFLHWQAAFPGVWDNWQHDPPSGGFDAVIGNPPWDRMKMQEVEWFAARIPAIALNPRASDRKRAVAALRAANDPIAEDYARAAWTAETATTVARESGAYKLLSGGDTNIYSLMVERAASLVRADGIVGLLVPSGIAADLGAAPFFRSLSTTGRLGALFDFENRRPRLDLPHFFPDVDSRFKFSALIFAGNQRKFPAAACAFFNDSATGAEANAFPLAPEDFNAVNPNTGTAPIFRTPSDAAITKAIYARLPVLTDRRTTPPSQVWPVRYCTMFHMTNDSARFRTEAELRRAGAYQLANGAWEKGAEKYLPLYEGKMVQAYDHRAASVVVNPANLHRPAQPEATGDLQHTDPKFRPKPQFYVDAAETGAVASLPAVLAFKDVTAPTNVRTMIAAITPAVAFGNTLPILVPAKTANGDALTDEETKTYCNWVAVFTANLNSVALDFIARQKVQGQHLNYYIVEQLPVIPASRLRQKFGSKTAAEIIREDVLALTYTAHDLDAFARALGHTGKPFRWDPEDRLRRRARLDALFFLLYGLTPDDAEYILSTFPILRDHEHAAYGCFRSQTLILNTMNALTAGAPDAKIAG